MPQAKHKAPAVMRNENEKNDIHAITAAMNPIREYAKSALSVSAGSIVFWPATVFAKRSFSVLTVSKDCRLGSSLIVANRGEPFGILSILEKYDAGELPSVSNRQFWVSITRWPQELTIKKRLKKIVKNRIACFRQT
jgi:hypothetical protein